MITVFIFKWIELMMPLNLREKNKTRNEIENKIHFYLHSWTPILILLSTIAHINICKPFLSILFCHLSRPRLYNAIKNIYKHNFVTGALCCYKDSIDALLRTIHLDARVFETVLGIWLCCSVKAFSESVLSETLLYCKYYCKPIDQMVNQL